MSDDPKKKGKADASRVSKQKHELAYTAKKTGTSKADVLKAKAKVGSSRKKVEAELAKH